MKKLTNSELHRMEVEDYKKAPKTPLIVILDDVRSLNNIGSVFRSSDAFRIEKIYLCGITACPPHKDIHKTALGATQSVDWEYKADIEELIRQLHQENIETIAIEQVKNATMLHEFSVQQDKKYAVVFGNEVKGVRQEVVSLCRNVVEIPQLGTKHSLNISVSVGIVLWDLTLKLHMFNKM